METKKLCFNLKIAKSRGMCAGVERAIKTVSCAIKKYSNQKIYVLHEVVHNKHVVDDLINEGATFVETLEEVPKGAVLIFSAHGVGLDTISKAKPLGFTIIDATCPVVSGIHRKMNRAGDNNQPAIVIGHKGHQEVVGTIGQYTGDSKNVHVILTPKDVEELNIDGDNAIFATQTTLSIDETKLTVDVLKAKYPGVKGPKVDDTCRATQVRQNAVRDLASICDVILIAGSKNSSNSNRLKEVAQSAGASSYLIDDSSQIDLSWFENAHQVGLSAGASAPEYVVEEITQFLLQKGAMTTEEVGSDLKEKSFLLPSEVLP